MQQTGTHFNTDLCVFLSVLGFWVVVGFFWFIFGWLVILCWFFVLVFWGFWVFVFGLGGLGFGGESSWVGLLGFFSELP